MTTIKTTWGKVFENSGLVLFNEFPNILNKLEQWDDLAQWDDYDEETDSYNEIYQWYIVPHADDVEWLEEFCPEIACDIHFSETIGQHVLAVRHYGTGWDAVQTELQVEDEELAKFYQTRYHDDLPDWVKRNVLNEKEG